MQEKEDLVFAEVELAMDAAGVLIRLRMSHRAYGTSPATENDLVAIKQHIVILENGLIAMDSLSPSSGRKALIKGSQALLASFDDLISGKESVLLIENTSSSSSSSRDSYQPNDRHSHYALYDSWDTS